MNNLTLLDLSEAKQKLAARSGLSLTSPEFFTDIFTGLKTASGKLVTRETAIRCSGVLACMRILMEDVSIMPLLLKRKTKSGTEDAVKHSAYRLFATSPNPFQTSVEIREHVMMDLILSGHSACWLQRDGKGDLTAVYPLHASRLTYKGQQQNGDLVWNYSSPEITKEFTQQELWRTNIMSQYIIDGRALIMLAREAIGLAMAAEEQGARFFSNGIQTNIVLKTANSLDTDGRNQLRDALYQTYAGSGNSWKALLLENGLDVSKIGLTAQESQYIESRNLQLAEIARIFRIPEVLLGISSGKTSTFASAEQFFQSYVKHTILPWAVRLEQTLQRDVLLSTEQDYFFKHQLAALLRADQKTRYESYQIGINAGWLLRSEARSDEDRDVIEGLDKPLIPVTMAILNPDGTLPKPEPVTPPAGPGKPGQPPKDNNAASDAADRIATFIIRRETRQFIKNQKITNAGWHIALVMDLTGCKEEAAAVYSAWRCAPGVDPLADDVRAEARQRINNLCLGVTL